MRIVNIVMLAILVLFAVAQFNDPDGLFWALIYGVGAVWCAVAAFRAAMFAAAPPFLAYVASMAGAVFGMVWFWPRTPGFWRQDVWWETETAREGMGMMILVLALVAAGVVAMRARRA